MINNYGKGAVDFVVKNIAGQFWGVRVEVGKELAKQKGSGWCRDAFARLLETEKEPKVLYLYLSLVYRDSKFTPILKRLLEEIASPTPLVHGGILQALALQDLDDENRKALLVRITETVNKDKRIYALVRRGAYKAAGNLETVEAWQYLVNRLNEEEFGEVKDNIISSLASKLYIFKNNNI